MGYLRGLARATAAAATVAVLGACSGNAPVCATPPIFNGPAIVNPALISPAPGATGVSTGPLDVTIGSAFDATALYVQDPNGATTFATNFRQTNPPSNDSRTGTFAQLASQTTYKVYANVSGPSFPQNTCGPNPESLPVASPQLLGSFTTR